MNKIYADQQIITDAFDGLHLLEPDCYHDFRGYYWTIYSDKTIDLVTFHHDKITVSKKNVLRGIHGDFNTTKLVSCVYGEIYCIVVDKRPHSPTYNQWLWSMLSHTNRKAVILPPGVGLGYLIMSPEAAVLYKLSYDGKYQDAQEQFTFKWNDPELSILWPSTHPILQERDA